MRRRNFVRLLVSIFALPRTAWAQKKPSYIIWHGPLTVTLPSAKDYAGKVFKITKPKRQPQHLTVEAEGKSYVLTQPGESITLASQIKEPNKPKAETEWEWILLLVEKANAKRRR